MGKPRGSHHVITGSFTKSGAPAYLTASGVWSDKLEEAGLIESVEERDQRLALVAQDEFLVCDAYSFMVSIADGVIDPLSARESIRAKGPTVLIRRPDSGMGSQPEGS